MAIRCVRHTTLDMCGHGEGWIHQHDAGAHRVVQMIVDVGRVVPRDRDIGKQQREQIAAVAAASPSAIGVENCCSAWLSSDRRVCDGRSPAILSSMARKSAGIAARARMAGPNLRKNRICAASQAS